jgi:hypothetical protein
MYGVTRYPFTAPPLVLTGACHETVARRSPGTAVGFDGATLVPAVTAAERAEKRLQPTEFLAPTVNVYELPFFKPVIFCDNLVEWNTLIASRTSL